jgi:hypothetical protein
MTDFADLARAGVEAQDVVVGFRAAPAEYVNRVPDRERLCVVLGDGQRPATARAAAREQRDRGG